MAKLFPILTDWRERKAYPDYPRSVPWSFIAPHERQADRNHGQMLKRLAERGGLSPWEMLAVVTGKRIREMERTEAGFAAARPAPLKLLEAHNAEASGGTVLTLPKRVDSPTTCSSCDEPITKGQEYAMLRLPSGEMATVHGDCMRKGSSEEADGG
ncbi:hypothetical protein LCGC14_1581130 [marine sediment metagenome]|uniref:Uncharacterized protein n=1 Tax=marine sediment metagenome TaxID=412755 RepID=A0A0F9IGT7_9ZZZZ